MRPKIIKILIPSIFILFSTFTIIFSTFAWVTDSKDAKSNGMDIVANKTSVDVVLYDDQMASKGSLSNNSLSDINFELPLPGASQIFVLEIKNTSSDQSYRLRTLSFQKPTQAEEKPIISTIDGNNVNNYFSTQLYVRTINYGTTFPSANDLESLFELESENPTEEELYGSCMYGDLNESSPQECILWRDNGNLEDDDITLNSNQSVYFVVKITFINADYDQSIYKNFGIGNNPSAYCKRKLYIDFS